MKIKTSELIGAQLDWAVAKATDTSVRILSADNPGEKWQVQKQWRMDGPFWPSQDWSQGGPLIEKHQIELKWEGIDGKAYWWSAVHQDVAQFQLGDKPLIAAMRAIVSAKLGEEIEVPEELV